MVEHQLPLVVSRLFNYKTIRKRATIMRLLSRIPIIQPDSYFWIIWRIILTCYILFFLFDISFLLTFGQQFWRDETSIPFLKAFYFVGVSFIAADVFIQFHVGYYQGGVLHKSRKDIFQKKALLVLSVDTLTLIVLILSFFIYSWALSILKIVFFLKVPYYQERQQDQQDLCLLHRRLRLFYQLTKITLIFVLYCHIIGCIFYGLDLILYSYKPSYVQNQYLWILNCPAYPNIISESWSVKYLYAAYWAVASTSTVGYGDIYPKNPIGNLLIIISNISICIIFGIFARSVISAFQNFNKINSNLKQQLKSLKQYSKIKRISNDLGRRIRRFIQFKSLLQGLKEESKIQEFKSKLSPQIRSRLCYIIYKPFLTSLPMSKDQFKLLQLANLITQQSFFEGELLNTDTEARSLYYIKQGYVSQYYQLSKSAYETCINTSKNQFRLLEYYTGFSSEKKYKFITHTEALILQGPPIIHDGLQREQFQQMIMQVVVYKDTSSLRVYCSICGQGHIEQDCQKIFKKQKKLIVENEQNLNDRKFTNRKLRKLRLISGISHKKSRELIQIDKVCNFQKYYVNFNILV